jgi:hypothetical protein
VTITSDDAAATRVDVTDRAKEPLRIPVRYRH